MANSDSNALSDEVASELRRISLLSDLPEEKLRQIVQLVEESTTERATEALREVDLFEDRRKRI